MNRTMNFDEESLLLSLNALNDGKAHLKASHLGNALALLKAALPPNAWIGLYLYSEKTANLILGPFMGTPACEEIPVGKGVVGECFSRKESLLIPNVREYPNYICCDESACSEICVPIVVDGKPLAVLDIDYPKGYSLLDKLPFFEKVALVLATWL